jgi:hypothetical protein
VSNSCMSWSPTASAWIVFVGLKGGPSSVERDDTLYKYLILFRHASQLQVVQTHFTTLPSCFDNVNFVIHLCEPLLALIAGPMQYANRIQGRVPGRHGVLHSSIFLVSKLEE